MSVRETLAGSPDVRRTNLAVLLRHLHLDGAMRRAELTDRSGLTRSTVAGLVGELGRLGAVEQTAASTTSTAGTPTRGRPSPVVRPCPLGVQVLAAEVRVDQVEVALVGLGGTVLHRDSRPLPDPSPEPTADLVARSVADLAHAAPGRVLGLGVAVPGVTRHRDGAVRFAPNLSWRDVSFGRMLSDRLPGTDVRVVNDGDAGVLAEHLRGVARGCDDVVFVEGEVGVGSGVVVDGKPLVGAGGYAGELGHIAVAGLGGRRCRCGSDGCWETEIGLDAVARALGLGPDASRRAVVDALRTAGDEEVRRLEPVARHLGAGLATVVNIFNPSLVVLGGLLRELYPCVAAEVRRTMVRGALAAPVEQVRLALPELGDDAVLLGAAEAVWQRVLLDPVAALGG
ncbi:Sugar kinase of the NBD/HSP70 family, may contain an N-terminal HTH domain [Microlunatus sagamiharensis]|uniref:Sugar kinase of the NBD/HSP70 family, may contain an N-terminal HTH domain n=1 Tax=Microlunatus sagamiharensis TaxID=546874 RepID=A0A1H2NAN9_9ACTN|nr:ROK family protein [Microlunatus sagamiharensis]SDV01896.1 Sugar kinase of the NBD/HSP70 family, may contain an N-terminal HTH domain [Microlunatus sagamiharensis]